MKPEALEKFKHFERDGINIYIKKVLNLESEVRFTLSKFLFFKSIEVRGIRVL